MGGGKEANLPFTGPTASLLPAEMQCVSGWGGGEAPAQLPASVLWCCQPASSALGFTSVTPNPPWASSGHGVGSGRGTENPQGRPRTCSKEAVEGGTTHGPDSKSPPSLHAPLLHWASLTKHRLGGIITKKFQV